MHLSHAGYAVYDWYVFDEANDVDNYEDEKSVAFCVSIRRLLSQRCLLSSKHLLQPGVQANQLHSLFLLQLTAVAVPPRTLALIWVDIWPLLLVRRWNQANFYLVIFVTSSR